MKKIIHLLLTLSILVSCAFKSNTMYTMEVTATAYNSVVGQTDGDPTITAFGDTLVPGKKYIAVSRDLLALGLKHNSEVKIEGFEGTYLVKDKMHRRWKERIDIYMGNDVKSAREWGKRKVTISFDSDLIQKAKE